MAKTEFIAQFILPFTEQMVPNAVIEINRRLQIIQKSPGLKIRLKIKNRTDNNPEIAQITSNWNNFFFSGSECAPQSFSDNMLYNEFIKPVKLLIKD